MLDLAKNHFDLFGLPVAFQVDTLQLAERYRELQKVVHPDRYAAADAQSQRLSLQNATRVNEAFQTLKNPLRRAEYLLTLSGVSLDASHSTLNDPEFLLQQMALREALAELEQASEPCERIDALRAEIDGLLRQQLAELAVLLDERSGRNLQDAARAVQKMQFLDKLNQEAEAVEADLERVC
jgi:molecular chaperone HscB